MKLQIFPENLQKKIVFVTHTISQHAQLPILLHVLLEAEKGNFKITATDLEIGIEITIPATIEEEGGITVPARIFLELINSLPQEKISLQTTNTTLTIIGKKIKSTLYGMNKDEFPSLYEGMGEEILELKQEILKKNFTRVCFAASLESTRPSLSGILIHKKEKELFLVATDGYRLSLQHITNNLVLKKQDGLEKPILVQARVIKEALLLKDEEEVKLYISHKSNQVIFSQPTTVLVGRLIEAEYPKYEKILPTDFSTKVFFDKDELQKAVKTSSIFARETANIIKLTFKKDRILVSANTPSVGDNMIEVEAKLEGEENEIAFNCRYLLDLFANIEEEEMTFEMTGPLNPGVFKLANDPSFLHLIMPIRTQG